MYAILWIADVSVAPWNSSARAAFYARAAFFAAIGLASFILHLTTLRILTSKNPSCPFVAFVVKNLPLAFHAPRLADQT
jgi:hypothetical protein